ncbi:MAG: ABC transporter permease [Actinomycetota bacterium]
MSSLAGTATLIRLNLRLDRFRLPAWVLTFGVLTYLTGVAFEELYPTVGSRRELGTTLVNNPALVAMVGPAFDLSSIGGLVAWRLGGVASVLTGLFAVFTVTRHTRAEEEAQRLELVMAGVVGRIAPLAAALMVSFAGSLTIGGAVAAALVALGQPAAGAMALGLGIACVGLTFAGVSAVTAQLTTNARTSSALAGTTLAAAYLIRAVGDSASSGRMELLSFASPVGWAQQVRPFAGERWWIFAMFATLLFICAGTAYVLITGRDLGAGVFEPRRGPARGGALTLGPFGLAWRLHQGSIAAWTVGFAITGAVFGSLAEGIGDLLDDTPQLREIFDSMGGGGLLEDVFFSSVLGLLAVVASAFAVQATLRLRSEETGYRAEPVLATKVGRVRWALSHMLPVTVGVLSMMAVAGASAGLVHGLRTGDAAGAALNILSTALTQVPAVLVLAGLTLALFGVAPRLIFLAWVALTAFLLLGQLGPILSLDQWVMNLSPFSHVPFTSDDPELLPAALLTTTALLLTAVGLTGLRRRDIG